MNLEHVSVESHKGRHQHCPPPVNQSTTFPYKDIEASCQLRSTRADIDQILTKLSHKGLFAKEHVKAYLYDLHRRNCRPSTIRTNSCSIILFLAFLKDLGKDQLEMITREDISAFIEGEQDRALKPNTVNTRLRALYAFFNFLIQRDVLHPDLLKRKMRIRLPDALPRAIDPEDIKQLLAVLKKPRDRALILMLLRTGMRIGELLATRMDDVLLGERKILIFEAEKNRVGRVVYLSDDALEALGAWLRMRETNKAFLFYSQAKQTMSYTTARSMFFRYLLKARLTHKGYSLHCLRHTFATELLNAGMRLECLQVLLGHQSLQMTRRYARLSDRTRQEEYFRAMAVIEREHNDGHHPLDHRLQALLEAEELLGPHGEELPEHP